MQEYLCLQKVAVSDTQCNFLLLMQATKLRSKLVEQKIPEEALWVTSPLTRAIDTLILACPQPQRLGSPPLAQAGLSASTSHPPRPLKLVVRRLVPSCDWPPSLLLAHTVRFWACTLACAAWYCQDLRART